MKEENINISHETTATIDGRKDNFLYIINCSLSNIIVAITSSNDSIENGQAEKITNLYTENAKIVENSYSTHKSSSTKSSDSKNYTLSIKLNFKKENLSSDAKEKINSFLEKLAGKTVEGIIIYGQNNTNKQLSEHCMVETTNYFTDKGVPRAAIKTTTLEGKKSIATDACNIRIDASIRKESNSDSTK